jgi:hypothetical protein
MSEDITGDNLPRAGDLIIGISNERIVLVLTDPEPHTEEGYVSEMYQCKAWHLGGIRRKHNGIGVATFDIADIRKNPRVCVGWKLLQRA